MVKTGGSAALRLRLVVTEHQENMGKRMWARREELHLSRDEVARRMAAFAAQAGEVDKTNGNAIYRWENGEVTPGPRKLDLLAKALETTVAHFMVEEPLPGTPNLMDAMSNGDPQLDRIERKIDALVRFFAGLEDAEDHEARLAALRNLAAVAIEQAPDVETPAAPRAARPPQHRAG